MNKILFLTIAVGLLACGNDPEPISPPASPVALDATEIVNDSFTANWEGSIGADGYELDVALTVDFDSVITGGLNLTGGSTQITDLTGNTEYFYRVRATINGVNASENSNIISLITALDAPIALLPSGGTPTGFTANWRSVLDVTDYLLYVSLEDFPAQPANNLPNFDGITVADTSYVVTGLTAATTYYYVVKAKIGENVSEESNSIKALTKN